RRLPADLPGRAGAEDQGGRQRAAQGLLVTWPVRLPGSWVASTEPGAVIARRECDEPFQGRGRILATCDRGPGARRTLPVTSLAVNSLYFRRRRSSQMTATPAARRATILIVVCAALATAAVLAAPSLGRNKSALASANTVVVPQGHDPTTMAPQNQH